MKAWQVVERGRPERGVRLVTAEPPTAGPGQVVVDVRAAGLGFPDYLLATGGYHDRPALPFTLGGEAAGVVSATGTGAEDVPTGQRVIVVPGATVFGHLQEQVVVDAELLLPLPDAMSFREGAVLFVAYHTAHLGLFRRGRLRNGQTLLVLGASGGVGSAAVQLGLAAGCRVMAVTGTTAKVDFVAQLGAHVVIDQSREDLVARVRELTDGRGVDVVFDPVGGDAFHAARRVVAVEGRLVVAGFASGTPAKAPTNHALLKNYDIVGFRTRPFRDDPRCRREIHDELVDLHARKLLPLPLEAVPFDEVVEALERLGARRVTGRLVVDVGAPEASERVHSRMGVSS